MQKKKEEFNAFKFDLEKRGQHLNQKEQNLNLAQENHKCRVKEIEQILIDIEEKERKLNGIEEKIVLNEKKL